MSARLGLRGNLLPRKPSQLYEPHKQSGYTPPRSDASIGERAKVFVGAFGDLILGAKQFYAILKLGFYICASAHLKLLSAVVGNVKGAQCAPMQ